MISLDEVMERISQVMAKAYLAGSGWWYVRVWPDGNVTDGCNASQFIPESEYFRRGVPYPVTVWSMQANHTASPGDGLFEWEPCVNGEEPQFWADATFDTYEREPDATHTVPCKLSTNWVNDCDLTYERADIRQKLIEAGYEVA